MSITIVLPSNQELWKLKPNRDVIHAATENNDVIGKIVGLTSVTELREYLGNETRMTRTKCMYMHLVLLVFTTLLQRYLDVLLNKRGLSLRISVSLARFQPGSVIRGFFP